MCPIIFHGQNVSPIVGSIGGTINASMYGGAIYSIPIELPKGIGNMQPELEIVYNSQCGNSLLGYGWNMLLTIHLITLLPSLDISFELAVYPYLIMFPFSNRTSHLE